MTRFVRTVAAALALTAVLATPRAGDAQVLVNESTGTPVPLAFVYLNAGTTYYFTTAVTSPLVPGGATQNPVLTLMSDWNVRVAGAQFCSLDFTKACFTYTPTTSNLYMLVLHGDNTLSPGRATVWQSQSAYCTNSSCSDLGATGEVRIWNDVAFGGDTVSVTAPTSGRVHYHTLHRPGNAIFHTLFARTTTAANFPERISRIAFNGWSGTGRIRGTVKFDTTNPTTFGIDGTREWVVGPSFPDQLGAVRLVRNSWFTVGYDGDGDGLSYQVEVDLDTCDEFYDYVRPGVPCSQLHVECQSGGDPNECDRLLRDTDSDGLRDDLEVYGFDSPSSTTKDLRFAQWGANPRHMDVFVEMDFMLYKSRMPAESCGDYAWAYFASMNNKRDVRFLGSREYDDDGPDELYTNFFDLFDDVYSQASQEINPDGNGGISVHFDVGVSNPNPLDTRWGSWGGGNTCVHVEYANIPDSDPMFCGRDEAYANDNRCNCPSNVCFDQERRPMFRYAIDGHDGGGQASGPKYAAGFTSIHVHELAHTLGLGHGGPYGSLGDAYQAEGNYRPTYPSRINYLYQDYGGLRGEGDSLTGASFAEIAFSDASWAGRSFSTRASPEVNPVPGANLLLMQRSPRMFGLSSGARGNLGGGWHRVSCSTPGACNVDWNLDGDDTGVATDNRLMMFRQDKRARRGYLFDEGLGIAGDADLVLVNNHLVLAYPRATSGGVSRLAFRIEGDRNCNEFPNSVGAAFPSCFTVGDVILPTNGGSAVLADAVAGRFAALSGGGTGLIVVYRSGSLGALSWAEVSVGTSSGSTEGTLTPTWRGTFDSGAITSPVLGRHSDGSTLLGYVDASGRFATRRLPSGGTVWSTLDNARDPAGTTLTGFGSTPSLMEFGGDTYMVGREGTSVRVRRLVASTGRWELVNTINSVLQGTVSAARDFEAVVTPATDRPGQNEVWIFYRTDALGPLRFARGDSPTASPSFWVSPTQRGWNADVFLPGSPAGRQRPIAAYDSRTSVSSRMRELRLLEHQPRVCAMTPDCASGTCNTVTGVCEQSGVGLGTYRWLPFARGLEPSMFCAYDDWTKIQSDMCLILSGGSTATDDFVRNPYSQRECYDPPVQLEASSAGGGTCVLSSPGTAFTGPSSNDEWCNPVNE